MPGDCIVGATGRSLPSLKCLLCGEIFPMQSNLARPGPVAEEDILYFVPGEPPRQRAPATHRAPEESPSQREAGGAINEVPAGA